MYMLSFYCDTYFFLFSLWIFLSPSWGCLFFCLLMAPSYIVFFYDSFGRDVVGWGPAGVWLAVVAIAQRSMHAPPQSLTLLSFLPFTHTQNLSLNSLFLILLLFFLYCFLKFIPFPSFFIFSSLFRCVDFAFLPLLNYSSSHITQIAPTQTLPSLHTPTFILLPLPFIP